MFKNTIVAVMWTCVPKYFCQKLRILCSELFDPLHMIELKWSEITDGGSGA
jgi:hypothetical protein